MRIEAFYRRKAAAQTAFGNTASATSRGVPIPAVTPSHAGMPTWGTKTADRRTWDAAPYGVAATSTAIGALQPGIC
ncbi:MAG: hypothetical protein KDD51_06675 [Bdellovibrionales bacterium]|nr:hypothetical protein [Bdellovibrionales bacterium]